MSGSILALCGGVGGAKLAHGLYRVLPPETLTVVVNTGDDFDHLGLRISPDVDTVLYTLAGIADPDRGWGRAEETWNFMAALGALGGDCWFQLGDRDLAVHVERSRFLREGGTLAAFVAHAARRLGIEAQVVPMTDDDVRTIVDTAEGVLPFQRYFVERQCRPVVRALCFDGAARARPAADFVRALESIQLRGVIICPSNPYLSIDPILAVPGVRRALSRAAAPIVAVSPLIAGRAVKGPTAKIMGELGIPATTSSIAAHYRGLIDGLVVDAADAAESVHLDVPTLATPTLMRDDVDRMRLAYEVVAFADELRRDEERPTARRLAATGRFV